MHRLLFFCGEVNETDGISQKHCVDFFPYCNTQSTKPAERECVNEGMSLPGWGCTIKRVCIIEKPAKLNGGIKFMWPHSILQAFQLGTPFQSCIPVRGSDAPSIMCSLWVSFVLCLLRFLWLCFTVVLYFPLGVFLMELFETVLLDGSFH